MSIHWNKCQQRFYHSDQTKHMIERHWLHKSPHLVASEDYADWKQAIQGLLQGIRMSVETPKQV